MTEKRCPVCELVLPIEAFGKSLVTPTGRKCYCKACTNKKSKAYYAKPEVKKMALARMQRYNATPAGRAKARKYGTSHKGRETHRRHSAKPDARARKLAYAQTEDRKVAQSVAIKTWRAANKDNTRAHSKVSYAIATGRIKRAAEYPCSYCGLQANEYHHIKGYSAENALNVVPLCRACHNAVDRAQRIIANFIAELAA